MTHNIIVEVNTRNIHDSEEEIMQYFGMKVPTRISLYFTSSLIEKMKRIKNYIENDDLTVIETLSSYKNKPDESCAVFYDEEEVIKVSQYKDFDTMWDTVGLKSFKLTCDRLYGNKFKASFIYTSASCYEIIVETEYFEVDDIVYFVNI